MEGLQFMHSHNVAHRCVAFRNEGSALLAYGSDGS